MRKRKQKIMANDVHYNGMLESLQDKFGDFQGLGYYNQMIRKEIDILIETCFQNGCETKTIYINGIKQ